MSKGTILYIGGFELPDKNAAAQRVVSNAKALRELNYKVVFVGVNKELDKTINIETTKSSFENFTCYSRHYPSNVFEWLKYLSNNSYIDNFIDSNTVAIIAYNYPGLALLKLIKRFKNTKIKIIADCTEWYQPKGNVLYVALKKIDSYLRMLIAQKKVHAVIAISNYLENYYKKFDVNTINVPPLVDLDMDKWQHLDYSTSHNIVKLIYCGSPGLGGKDKLDYIIDIVSKLIKKYDLKIEFIVVGLSLDQYVQGFGKNSNLNKNILFKGRLPHVTVLKLIAASDFQIFFRDSSLANNAGFPTKLVESISCGTPVITNYTSNISDYIIDGKNGYLLKENSVENNASKLESLLRNKEKNFEMKKYCKLSKHFHYKNYQHKFENILVV
jgi:glycosyltransferase involved in cell wall biosynthesis